MVRIDSRDPDFAKSFAHLLTLKREIAEDVDDAVRKIIADVVAQGDDALVAYTRRFDRLGDDFSAERLRIGPDEVAAAVAACPAEAIEALKLAAERSRPSTGPKNPPTTRRRMRWASPPVGAGRRSNRSASTFRAGRRATRPPC